MDVKTWTYLIVGFTFALYIGIAIWSRAKSTKEFYVAGGNISPLSNGMATAADWMSAASFLSMAGIIAFSGYGGSVFLMGWTGGYVLLAFLVAPYLRKYGKFTVPEFIGERFYSKTARLVAVLCLILVSVTYVIGQMRGVGIAFSRFLETDITTGLLVGMGIVFFYAVLGGMKGITYTQIAQYVVLIFAFTVPAIFISLELTGNPIPQLGLIGDYKEDGTPLLQKLDTVITDLGFGQYTNAVMGSKLNMFAFTLSLMIGTAGLPHVIIRFFTVKKVSDARLSAGWALVFIAILYTTAPAVAAMARLNFTKTIQTDKVGVASGNIEITKLPDWFDKWENTGLLKYEDKNGDVVVSATAYDRLFDKDRNGPFTESSPHLTRWILDLKSGSAKSEQLDDRSIEFPRIHPDHVSKSNQFGYALASSNFKKPDFKEIVKYDFVNDTSEVYEYGSGNFGAEPVFVPSEGANDEDEGYLLSLVYDQETDKSDLIILNAQEVSSGPLAKVHLPQRVPFGFHGDWINI